MATEMRSPNVSVTPIKMEPYPPVAASVLANGDLHHHHHHVPGSSSTTTTTTTTLTNGNGEPPDSSDAEVAQIEFHSTMRSRKDRKGVIIGGDFDAPPRPMSWEGELSDGEHDMCIDDDHGSQLPENLSLSQDKQQHTIHRTNPHDHQKESPILRLKQQQPSQPPVSGCYSLHSTPSNSPLMGQRHTITGVLPLLGHKDLVVHKALNVPPSPSPDSAVHSAYSVFSSPNQSPLTQRHITLTPNLSRNNSDASHSSCYSCSSVSVSVSPTQQFSPTHSPIQGRHMTTAIRNSPLHQNVLYRSVQEDPSNLQHQYCDQHEPPPPPFDECDDKSGLVLAPLTAQAGISRQQLINSPCPICGDKISGFHYGIFSCESCKGFFKRTVQNRKNYVCLRGAACPVTVATRKKCPACRFDKCLKCGMKLEAIREDRTRGGRSTYQCSYSLPPSLAGHSELRANSGDLRQSVCDPHFTIKLSPQDCLPHSKRMNTLNSRHTVPPLLQEIMDVEHLWHYSEMELNKLNSENTSSNDTTSDAVHNLSKHPLLAGTGLAGSADTNPDLVANLCNIADHRLYKIVKWCKSLPLFKNISIDDQICLLINSWCELLLFSCCFRSMSLPGEIRISLGKSISLAQAREMGMQACIERMLNFTEQLRRLRVDKYEYVAMKVIVLLSSDTNELREAEKVRASQEKALKALQDYTLFHYPESPAKFGELLLRIPELQRTCQVGKELLTIKTKDGEGLSFNFLMELLRGDH